MKKEKEKNNGFKKKILSHIKEDSKEFKKQLADDRKLTKMVKKSKREYERD